MAYKVDKIDNYIILTDSVTGKEVEGHSSGVLITRKYDYSTRFFFKGLNERLDLEFIDILDKDGLAWADVDTWVCWYRANTGFSAGGGNGAGVVIKSVTNIPDGGTVDFGTFTDVADLADEYTFLRVELRAEVNGNQVNAAISDMTIRLSDVELNDDIAMIGSGTQYAVFSFDTLNELTYKRQGSYRDALTVKLIGLK